VRCTYDNTAENRARVGLDPRDTATVTWGENSSDEMCGGGLEVVGSRPSESSPSPIACNDLDASGACEFLVETSMEPLPVGAGGVIRDGVYELVAMTLRRTTDMPLDFAERGLADVRGGVWQLAGSETGRPEVRETKTMTTDGQRFVWTMSCPGTAVIEGTYDASPDSMALYYESRVGGIERRFVRIAE
jgi:hypothetical protein